MRTGRDGCRHGTRAATSILVRCKPGDINRIKRVTLPVSEKSAYVLQPPPFWKNVDGCGLLIGVKIAESPLLSQWGMH